MSPFCRGVSLRVGSYLGLPVSVLVQAAIAAAPLSSTKRDPLLTSRQLRLLTPGSALLENLRTLSLGCCSFGCQPRLLRRPRGEARVGGVPARSPPHGSHECGVGPAARPRLQALTVLKSCSWGPRGRWITAGLSEVSYTCRSLDLADNALGAPGSGSALSRSARPGGSPLGAPPPSPSGAAVLSGRGLVPRALVRATRLARGPLALNARALRALLTHGSAG